MLEYQSFQQFMHWLIALKPSPYNLHSFHYDLTLYFLQKTQSVHAAEKAVSYIEAASNSSPTLENFLS